MPLYLVEAAFNGITLEALAELQREMVGASEDLTRDGKFVRFIRATFLPGDSRCLCLFEATDPTFAQEATERARIPSTTIVNAVELSE
jgi:muconolactone delta-isomerase